MYLIQKLECYARRPKHSLNRTHCGVPVSSNVKRRKFRTAKRLPRTSEYQSISTMIKPYVLAGLVAVLMAPPMPEAATSLFKCTINGSITYQNTPCPASEPRKAPTVEQLNAERRKKLRETAESPSNPAASTPKGQFSSNPGGVSGSQAVGDKERPNSSAAPVALPHRPDKCDGRIHCSQMTSCSEAKYFLSNCPGVKMDGDNDGIPCEDQWCR